MRGGSTREAQRLGRDVKFSFPCGAGVGENSWDHLLLSEETLCGSAFPLGELLRIWSPACGHIGHTSLSTKHSDRFWQVFE